MDKEIELAKPNFIPLAPEEAAEAVRLFAALIRAISIQDPDSLPPCQAARCPVELADGSPPAPGDRGKPRFPEGAGGEL